MFWLKNKKVIFLLRTLNLSPGQIPISRSRAWGGIKILQQGHTFIDFFLSTVFGALAISGIFSCSFWLCALALLWLLALPPLWLLCNEASSGTGASISCMDTLLFFLWNDFSAPSGSPLAWDTAFSHVVSGLNLCGLIWENVVAIDSSDTGAMALIWLRESGVSVMSNVDRSESLYVRRCFFFSGIR